MTNELEPLKELCNNRELMEWSRAIADACVRTTIKPEDVEAACAAWVRAANGRKTNYEKYASTPEKVASLVSQFRGALSVGAAWKSYMKWLVRRRGNRRSPTQLMTEWLQEECDA